MSDNGRSFWRTVPGILTGIAALITAITGLVVALRTFGPSAPAQTPTFTVPPAESATPTATEHGGAVADNELWINSHPTGAEVYLVPATVDVYDLELEDVMKPQNLLGTAPLTHELSQGTYYVVASFTPDLFTAIGYDLPTYSDPGFDDAFPFDGNLFHSTSFIGGEEIERFSKIYRLIKDPRSPEALISIALPLPANQRGQPKPALYPTLATVDPLPASYTFDDAIVRQGIEDDLSEHNLTTMVGPSMVDEMVEVLLRVGKVKLDTSDVEVIIQMGGTQKSTFSITVYR